MAQTDTISVALWGPTFSGKTSFLSTLYLHPGQFRGDWEIFPTEEAEQFIDEARLRANRSEFPDATMPGIIRNVTYGFRNKRTGQQAKMFVEDRAGREWTELDEEAKKRLSQASGLVILFDPERHLRDIEQQIESTLGRLHVAGNRGFEKDARPIAVCLSKADCLIRTPDDLHKAKTHPREFVIENVPGSILARLDNFCSNFELFPISSTGVRLRYGVVESLVFYDEECHPRIGAGSDPVNLIEPFAWIFSRLNGGQLG